MPRKQRVITDLPADMHADWVQALELPPLPPKQRDDGSPNPEYYQEALGQLNIINRASMLRGEPMKGFDSALKAIVTEAEYSGFDPKTIQDARSDADKFRDAVDKILDSPNDTFSLVDDDLRIMLEQMEKVVRDTQNIIDSREMDSLTKDAAAERQAKGKAWLTRIRATMRVREMARVPYSPKWKKVAAPGI